ncbi:MAG: AmmeMemoRadiSam system radical SAM enzyme [Cocleimonas sp.]
MKNSQPAQHWVPFKENRAECQLCPRHCRPKNDRMGFCGVRGTVNGELHTFNYGQSLAATEEVIETEAVNHYAPGARILSMGNIGCMMSCSFCQNWETSQTKHLDYKMVRDYTPEDLIELCKKNAIQIISWTYNDPVVWHEFVVKTSKLAQKIGIKTLYKSAFYIEELPVKELIECIDIFSLSLKSLNAEFYQKVTKAKLQPVLDRIKQVAASDCHLEISQLVIPELNDSDQDIIDTIDWIKNNIGNHVPLHFVAFHPAYKYTHVERTTFSTLEQARKLAISKGMKYVYLGNTYEADSNDSLCPKCQTTWVTRYGLYAKVSNLDKNSCCTNCGEQSPILEPHLGVSMAENVARTFDNTTQDLKQSFEVTWNSECQSIHILQSSNTQKDSKNNDDILRIRSIGNSHIFEKQLAAGLDRFIISRQSQDETGIVVSWDSDFDYQNLTLLDRAHYPTAPTNINTSIENIPVILNQKGLKESVVL